MGRLRVLAAGAVDGRPRASTLGIVRVDGLHCSLPVEFKVTKRSQPFVEAQIERAEADEALRTPLRPSGRVLAVGDVVGGAMKQAVVSRGVGNGTDSRVE